MSKPSCLACQRADHQRCDDPQTVPVDDVYLSPGEWMVVCCCAEAHEISGSVPPPWRCSGGEENPMPRPLDPDLRDLLTEAVKVLEGPEIVRTREGDTSPRYVVSTVLRTVSTSTDPSVVNWATAYLRKVQRDQESNAPPAPGEREQVAVAYQIRHWRDRDGWWFAVDLPGRPGHVYGHYSTEQAMLDAKVERMRELETGIVESERSRQVDKSTNPQSDT
jgi:hypothetical protein